MTPPPRPQLLARGKMAERANAFLGKAWDRGWLSPPVLEPDALWDVAAKPFRDRAKAAEYGGRSSDSAIEFRLRLEKLLDAVRAEADLNPLGQAMAYGQLTRVIGTRLALGDYWERNPFPRDVDFMEPPIFIIGHMRSGTTRVHKLFAADPAHSCTRYCDAWRPAPGNLAVRRIKGSLDLAMLGALNPWLQSIHPMKSGEVEEELAWLAGALNHSIYESQWHIPAYSAFSEARDPGWIYLELSKILTTDALHRGTLAKPRVMKAPQFSEDLACLLEMYPNARVIVTQRAKEDVLRSAVSLVANQMAIQSDSCDLRQITAFCEHKIALRDERREDALANWNGPITRLTFDALSADWESEIARAYSDLDLTLSPQALTAMRAMMARESKGAHNSHAAQLQSFSCQT
ncbi:MAG: sulfotransferase [Pseudomonadota bacterium]